MVDRLHRSTFASLEIILVVCMFIASCMPFLAAPGTSPEDIQASPTSPHPATTQRSSDPTGGEWPMFRRALNHTGVLTTTVYKVGVRAGPTWNYTTGSFVYSSPAVAGGYVYVGSDDDNMYCLNATTGARVWNYTTGEWVYSSPAVAGGYVYEGSLDDNLYCLNATTGIFVWSYFAENLTTEMGGIFSSPAVAGGCVYVGSLDDNLYCLNATTGSRVWNYTTGGGLFDGVYSSPAIAGGFVYVGSEDCNLYCFPLISFIKKPPNMPPGTPPGVPAIMNLAMIAAAIIIVAFIAVVAVTIVVRTRKWRPATAGKSLSSDVRNWLHEISPEYNALEYTRAIDTCIMEKIREHPLKITVKCDDQVMASGNLRWLAEKEDSGVELSLDTGKRLYPTRENVKGAWFTLDERKGFGSIEIYVNPTPTPCAICGKPMEIFDEQSSCPACGVTFHVNHLEEWMRTSGACPGCKVRLVINDSNKIVIA
ncbi:MAG TPA: PQQ-binding-like beta-propeller repeat protein [Candidatus Lokiarchaeia archaeon]|nr:PQQ-binding-like beta-propeller repeat protein [Candidatus Lokiarchaeia archaeon]